MENPFRISDEEKEPAQEQAQVQAQAQAPVQAEAPQQVQAQAQAQPQLQPQPQILVEKEIREDFVRWFDAQIEQAHEALDPFRAQPKAPEVTGATAPASEASQAPEQDQGSMWKYLIILAGALVALALAAPFIRKLLGRKDDNGGWGYRRGPLPVPPQSSSGGAAQQPEPSTNSTEPESVRPRIQDITSMALGKW